MKNFLVYALMLLLVVSIVVGCVRQAKVADVPDEETVPPVLEQPVEITVEDSAKDETVKLEPVVIEIIAARDIEPFNPVVKVGQEVIFVNKHVDGREDREYYIKGDRFADFESPLLKPGDRWSHVFDTPGDYQYKIMPGAAGRVSVVGNFVKWLKGMV